MKPPDLTPAKKFTLRLKGLEVEIDSSEGRRIRESLVRDDYGDPKLTAKLVASMVKLITEGCTLNNACKVCGLRRNRLEKWLEKGRQDLDKEPPEMSDEAVLTKELDGAQGDQEHQLSKIVMSQATHDPKLALDTLARRNAKDWAPALPEPIDYGKLYSGADKAAVKAEIDRLLREKER